MTFNVGDVSFTMVFVEGGTFMMGATEEQAGMAEPDEQPVREVKVRNYYIAQTEVTQALWQAVMGNNPSNFVGDNLPVERVSWDEVQKFCAKLSRLTGYNFRLPTEAEWEFAARGGKKSRGYLYSGGDNLDDVAWFDDNSGERVHPVATKQPNELDIYDMSGNVREWCSDWYGKYDPKATQNPTDRPKAKNASCGADHGSVWRTSCGSPSATPSSRTSSATAQDSASPCLTDTPATPSLASYTLMYLPTAA